MVVVKFKPKLLRSLLIAVVSMVLCVPYVAAQDEGAENSEDKTEIIVGNVSITYLRLAGELASIAGVNRDSILMLAAAILEKWASVEVTTRGKVNEGQDGATQDKPAKGSLFELAEEYAGSNEHLLAIIRDSEITATMKGRVHGADVHVDRVLARDADIYREVYRAKEPAEVAVVGDGDTDLDLYIYDEYGNLVCDDTGYTDRAYCSWTPRWEGAFEIEIRNLGDVYNEYRLFTN